MQRKGVKWKIPQSHFKRIRLPLLTVIIGFTLIALALSIIIDTSIRIPESPARLQEALNIVILLAIAGGMLCIVGFILLKIIHRPAIRPLNRDRYTITEIDKNDEFVESYTFIRKVFFRAYGIIALIFCWAVILTHYYLILIVIPLIIVISEIIRMSFVRIRLQKSKYQ